MIQRRLYRIFLMVTLLIIHPVIMASDWVELTTDLEQAFLEYVDKAEIDEPTKKKHKELINQLCEIHEKGAKSNQVFEIIRYYDQFDPDPDVKLDLVLTRLWFDALAGVNLACNVLSDNLLLVYSDGRKKHKKTEEYFIDKLPKNNFTIHYCDSLKKSGKKYFNIFNFRLLDKHDPITQYVSWFKKAKTAYKKAHKLWESNGDAKLAVKEYEDVLPDNFPDVWLNALMEYADFQKEFSKTQKKLEQLLSFYNSQKNSELKALEYLRRLKNARFPEYKRQDNFLRGYLFSFPVMFYRDYRYFQYVAADNWIWFDDKDTMRHAAMQLSKLTPFIPYLDELVVKRIMETQRIFKDKFGEKEYQDIVMESKLLPHNWADVFKKLTPP